MTATRPIAATAAGLGLRRALLGPLQAADPGAFDFLECAPENWIGVGGRLGEQLRELSRRHPLSCHGLSLSLGGTRPFDDAHLRGIRAFLDAHGVALYSEHLSWCNDDGQLYDLLPIPQTEEAVRHVAARIREVQDRLGRRIGIENVSTYALPFAAMPEVAFVSAVLEEADCDLLLDVNNVYVNAINHGFDPYDYLARLPAGRVMGYHVAGHLDEADDLKIDTHGAPVKDAVWALFDAALARFGPAPALLERDFDFPPFAELVAEVARMRRALHAHAAHPRMPRPATGTREASAHA